ncbi:MAG TPA: hypothetical protein VHX87_10605, partial [Galbitalea sp.]|nr:hypothetical protein [Galbitalea sp.]
MTYALFESDGLILAAAAGHHLDDRRTLIRDAERGTLVRIRRGAYVEASRWDGCSSRERHLLRIRAANAASDAPIVVARESAAALWGMPIAGSYPDDVTVLVEWPGGGSSEAGVRRTVDGFHSAEIVEVDGILTTSLARTALDVARFAPFADAMGSIDWALWRRNPSAIPLAELAADFERWGPRVGRRQLRRAIPFASALSDSFGES